MNDTNPVDFPWKARRLVLNKAPYLFIGEMFKLIEKSVEYGKEFGFPICYSDEKGFYTGSRVVGREKGILFPAESCGKDTWVGIFHTHPTHKAEFSIPDIANVMTGRVHVTCVGAVEEREKDLGVAELRYPSYAIKCIALNPDHPDFEKYEKRIESLSDSYHGLVAAAKMLALLPEHELQSKWGQEKIAELAAYFDEVKERFDRLLDEMERKGVIHTRDQGVEAAKEKVRVVAHKAEE